MPLVSGIRPEGLEDPEVRRVVDQAMQLEDYLISQELLKPVHAVFVARPEVAHQSETRGRWLWK